MGFTSLDDIINQISVNGKYLRRESQKSTAPVHTAGGWHLLCGLNGYPNQSTYPSTTDLMFKACTENWGDGTTILGMLHGGVPAGTAPTKHILNVGASVVAAAGAPWQLKLVDLEGYYKLSGANVTGTSLRTCINTDTVVASSSGGLLLTYTYDWNSGTKVRFTTSGTLPTGLSLLTDYWLVRQSSSTALVATSYANAVAGTVVPWTDNGSGTHTMTIQMRNPSGTGVEACFVSQTLPTAGGPEMRTSAYTNSGGTGTRSFQPTASPYIVMNATADAYAARVIHSAAAAGRYGAFLPKQAADAGIQKVDSFTWNNGTAYTGTGVIELCLVKPLCDIIVPATGVWTERDLVNQLPSLPKVETGACLAWMLFGAGATTTGSPVISAIDFAWGG